MENATLICYGNFNGVIDIQEFKKRMNDEQNLKIVKGPGWKGSKTRKDVQLRLNGTSGGGMIPKRQPQE